MEKDLTVGSVPKLLLQFAFPLLLANLLQSLYSIVDMVIVGRFVGGAGLAAISSASTICFLINSICIGATMGGTVLVAQYTGARSEQDQRETVGTLFSVSLILAVLVTVISLLAYPVVFTLMNVPGDAMGHALDYMQVICLGNVFVFGYNAVCSVMRGLGDSKIPLAFVAVAAVINIALDLLLVGALGLGTRGAALATILSQGVSFAAAVWYLRRRKFLFDFRARSFQICPEKGRAILRIGLPTAVQMSVLNLSYLLITGMFNSYGIAAAAAAGIGLKVNTFAAMPCWAIGQAVTTMSGQNLGAGDPGRAVRTAKVGIRFSVLFSTGMMIFVQLFAEPIVMLFNRDPEVVREGALYLRVCCSLNCPVYAAMYIYDSFATGAGAATLAMCNSLLHSVVMRLALSWVLQAAGLGYVGLCLGEALSPIIPAVVGAVFFYGGYWKKRSFIPARE